MDVVLGHKIQRVVLRTWCGRDHLNGWLHTRWVQTVDFRISYFLSTICISKQKRQKSQTCAVGTHSWAYASSHQPHHVHNLHLNTCAWWKRALAILSHNINNCWRQFYFAKHWWLWIHFSRSIATTLAPQNIWVNHILYPLCVWCLRMVIWYVVEDLYFSGSIETIDYGIQYVENVGKFWVILVHIQNKVNAAVLTKSL
jgi:hypothetical protein